MHSRVLVVAVVGLFTGLLSLSTACDPFPDECDTSSCDGNTALDCHYGTDTRNLEEEIPCGSNTCFVSAGRAFCGRAEACSDGETRCNGTAISTCHAAEDGKTYWADRPCGEYVLNGTCNPFTKDGVTSAVCR